MTIDPPLTFHTLTPPSDKWAALPPHVVGENPDRCVSCDSLGEPFGSYDAYVSNFWEHEYEGEPGHGPDSYEEWLYVAMACNGDEHGFYHALPQARDEQILRERFALSTVDSTPPHGVEMQLWQVQVPDRPTFYLDTDIQGIRDARHAAQIASNVVGVPVSERQVFAVHYHVGPVNG